MNETPPDDGVDDARHSAARSIKPIGWSIRYSNGTARSFHDLTPSPSNDTTSPAGSGSYNHQAWIHQVDGMAVVLGSTQRLTVPATSSNADNKNPVTLRDGRGRAVELCSRRSGGGLVVVDPTQTLWIDVIVPCWSPLHHTDVSKSFLWFGQVWVQVLLGALRSSKTDADAVDDPTIELGAPEPGRRAADRPFYCFDGIGHGEVLVDGRKVVGISQRRTRDWSRLQSLVAIRWDGAAINGLISPITQQGDLGTLGQPPYDATEVAAGLDPRLPAPDKSDLIRRFLRRLPAMKEARPSA